MAPNQPSQDLNRCLHCGQETPSPRADAGTAPFCGPDAYPPEAELHRALAQAQQVLSAGVVHAIRTGNSPLTQRCEQLVIDSATCWDIVVNTLPDDGQVACYLMDAAELGSELAATYRCHGAEREAVVMADRARGLARLSLQLDPDFWLADPHAFD
ncbi:hypothetical protein GCM10010840_14760 [Deinococcus aerolatus]|uniref:Uncharacterized protein n=1 Tax=Deinococcus aerolatus TaxID=522487 RepID=A0ABQ2G6H8_9DEIO|nr:hypothetical protein [Deinococcus aerolatus]GGL77910.1 hypothetical protein GCM10010840_14760 [Deinococcus aerolatus]